VSTFRGAHGLGRLLVDVRSINARVDTGLGVCAYQVGRHLAALCGDRVTFVQAPDAAPLGPNPPVRLRRPDFDLAADQKTLRTLTAAFGFELALSTFYPIPPSRRVPSVVMVQDLIPLRLPDQYRGTPVFDHYDVYLRASCRGAAHVVTTSHATRRDVMELYGIPERHISVIPLGADHFAGIDDVEDGGAPREIVDALAGHPFLLAACSTEPRKNLRGTLDAYARLRARLGADSPCLVLAGAGRGRRAEIDALVEAHGGGDGVIVTGPIDPAALAWLYRRTLCFVFPSLYEGFGLPVVEALRMGAPVVCSNRTSLLEIGGDAVHYAAPDSPDDLTRAMLEVIEDEGLRRDLKSRGPRQAERFQWRQTAAALLDVIQHVLGRPVSADPHTDDRRR
jgi:glycosyltransferase involved in cell wall biosynthesis